MTRLCQTYFLLTVLLLLSGCAQEVLPPEPQLGIRYPIVWSIGSVKKTATRALVDNTLLQQQCTPVAGSSCQSIGLWGQATVGFQNQNDIFQDFVSVPLTYSAKPEDSNPYNSWNYPGNARYWRSNAVYDFRACYPQTLMTSLMTSMSATMFQGLINTSVIQEDILVAAIQVDTRNADLSKPVPLPMQHVFSAIKFKVKAVEGFVPAANEGVVSCWLQNKTNDTKLFSPSGYLVHSGNALPDISWTTSESSMSPMYLWEHSGISFVNENTLYTSNGGLTGDEYTQNDGWLLVVPQQVKENTLSFCYTMKNSPGQSFSVNIPSITYLPGKQYVYVLEIRGSEVNIDLTISDWNYKESSYDIIM